MPGNDVREQVAVEGRVVIEQIAQVQRRPGGGELIETDLARGDLGPVALLHELMLGVGRSLADCLEDHAPMVAASPSQSEPVAARLDERLITTGALPRFPASRFPAAVLLPRRSAVLLPRRSSRSTFSNEVDGDTVGLVPKSRPRRRGSTRAQGLSEAGRCRRVGAGVVPLAAAGYVCERVPPRGCGRLHCAGPGRWRRCVGVGAGSEWSVHGR